MKRIKVLNFPEMENVSLTHLGNYQKAGEYSVMSGFEVGLIGSEFEVASTDDDWYITAENKMIATWAAEVIFDDKKSELHIHKGTEKYFGEQAIRSYVRSFMFLKKLAMAEDPLITDVEDLELKELLQIAKDNGFKIEQDEK